MNSSNEIRYSDYYVAFLDILGFEQLVRSKKQDDKRKIYEYFRLIENITRDLKKIDLTKDIGTIIISDSVILSVPIGATPDSNINKLRELCIAIQKIQFTLAENDIWLRGAISIGEAYFNSKENQIVGPAYINAYLLEKRNAINPRVVLDNKLISELELESADDLIDKVNNVQTCSREYNTLERNVLFQWSHGGRVSKIGLEKDVALFVDYLAYAFTEESKLKSIIRNIKKHIYSDNSIYSKFRWVADYMLTSITHHNNNVPCNIDNEVLIKQFNEVQKL